MEDQGSVTISLADFDNLREFYNKMRDGKYLCFTSFYRSETHNYYVINNSEEIENFHKDNKSLTDRIYELDKDMRELRAMSIWQFRRWRKNQKKS